MKNYTIDDLAYIESELRAFRLPLFTRLFKKTWFFFIKYTIFPAFCIVVILGLIYNGMPFWNETSHILWSICKGIILFYIFGVGGSALISHICELVSTNKLRKRLGLSQEELRYFVVMYQIKGM